MLILKLCGEISNLHIRAIVKRFVNTIGVTNYDCVTINCSCRIAVHQTYHSELMGFPDACKLLPNFKLNRKRRNNKSSASRYRVGNDDEYSKCYCVSNFNTNNELRHKDNTIIQKYLITHYQLFVQ